MKYIAAYCLCVVGGKEPSAANVKAVIEAAGGECDDDRLGALIAAVGDKDIHTLLAEGEPKLASMGGGGGGGGAAAAATDAAPAAVEKPKEEEIDFSGGVNMFGGGEGGGDY